MFIKTHLEFSWTCQIFTQGWSDMKKCSGIDFKVLETKLFGK